MAGDNPQKGSSTKPSSSSSAPNHRKSHRESASNNPTPAPQKPSPSKPPSNSKPSPSSKHKPSPKLNPNLIPSPRPRPENFAPPPPPAYGFHMLDRRTIVLADGTARSYFALPPDYQDFPPPFPRPPMRPHGPDSWVGFDRQFPPGRPIPGGDDHYRQENQEYWNSLGHEGSRKRKFGDERDDAVNDDFARQRQQLLQFGNTISNSNGSHMAGPSSRDEMRAPKHMRPEVDHRSFLGRHNEIDQAKLKTAFFNFVRLINENANQKKKYLADGKQGSLQCLACGRFDIWIKSRLLMYS